jgi:hypothetical protein
VKIENQKVTDSHDFEIGDCIVRIGDVEREIWKGISKASHKGLLFK